jgi:hypothetical protein
VNESEQSLDSYCAVQVVGRSHLLIAMLFDASVRRMVLSRQRPNAQNLHLAAVLHQQPP